MPKGSTICVVCNSVRPTAREADDRQTDRRICDDSKANVTRVSETIGKPPLIKAENAFKYKINKIWRKTIFSQPSIYIDGWLYGMRMTSVVCNVPVLSQNDSTYHHSVLTTWKWHPFATWTPSFIILVWGHHVYVAPYRICLPPELSLLLKRRSVNKFRHRYSMLWPLSVVKI